MALERTLSIVKPDGVQKNVIGNVYSRFENAGLRIVAARMMQLTQAQAEGFYAVHRERPFFKDLTRYMSSGPILVQVLEGENAVAKNRELMGDPRRPRDQHRRERRARLGQRRERAHRDCVLLRRRRPLPAHALSTG
jgi:nucleoside diphosphate kinase